MQKTAFDELRELFPPMIPLASRMAVMPAAFRRDLGPWSPWGRVQRYRKRYNEIIAELIAEARTDPTFETRDDVLALMLQARYEDGSSISDDHVADELLTLLSAGHETTAPTLAWAIERLRRHPRVLSRLAGEVDVGGSELLQATIWEVQRTRPVVEGSRAGVGMPSKQDVVDVGRGIELCYEQIGDPNDPPVVLIGGLGQQLHGSWPTDFATALAGRGYRVTRFHNRDVGRSTHMAFRRRNRLPYFAEATIRGSITSVTWRATQSACSTCSATRMCTSPASRWAG